MNRASGNFKKAATLVEFLGGGGRASSCRIHSSVPMDPRGSLRRQCYGHLAGITAANPASQ
ncbi:MAG: hypothetical protein GY733_14540 [bacterium]|nr:hypothetical protein [bacterium]